MHPLRSQESGSTHVCLVYFCHCNHGRKSCLLSVASLANSPASPRKPGEAADAGEREAASGGRGGQGDKTSPSLSPLILRLPPPASPASASKSLHPLSSASAFNSGCRSISHSSPFSPLLFASSSNRCLRLADAKRWRVWARAEVGSGARADGSDVAGGGKCLSGSAPPRVQRAALLRPRRPEPRAVSRPPSRRFQLAAEGL